MLTNEELNKKILEFEQTSAIEGGNPWAIYKCAKDVKWSNIEKLEDAIVKTGDVEFIYDFAMTVRGANVEKLKKAIIETKNYEYIHKFVIDKMEIDMKLPKDEDLRMYLVNSFADKLYNVYEKSSILKYLIENRELGINEIRLRIYFDYLNNPNSTEEDLEKCNEEYIRYVSMYYGEKDQEEETKENLEKNNEEEKSFVKVKK